MKELSSVKFQELKLLEFSVQLYEEGKKIKPIECPFCGGNDIGNGLNRRQGTYQYCKSCLASGPYGENDEAAILAWNNRYK